MPGAAGQSEAGGLQARRFTGQEQGLLGPFSEITVVNRLSDHRARVSRPAWLSRRVTSCGCSRWKSSETGWPSASEFGEAGEHRPVQRLAASSPRNRLA
jgi:hypothetical protein